MTKQEHFNCLESMYAAAPVNEFYKPMMSVREGEAVIEIELSEKFHHSAGGVHGSVYFKMLDDAAFFAANSLEPEFFVLTTSFTTYITRPVASGKMKAIGKVVNSNKSQFIAESVVYDAQDREIGRGSGIFVRGKLPLVDAAGYA
ncbi:PaaI family thioesterase [Litorivivens sp.]|uniref:PaaI family thioesterase n=1 Tax=Litorivivens sp. TaxID=2020868 RepID=UPI0035634833